VASKGKKEELKIRHAKSADAPRIAVLTGQLGYPATAAEMRKRLLGIKTASQHAVFVADSPGDGVIGWLHVSKQPLLESATRAEVNGLVVAEGQRSLGAGAQTRLQEHVGAFKRDSRARAQVLRTQLLRALQNAEIVPQTALTKQESIPNCS
jgi:hypothetical protein